MRTFLGALVLLAPILACSNPFEPPPREADHLRQALVDLVREKDAGEQIRLADAWPGDWDRAVVLRPYSTDANARDLLGFPFAYEGASPWTNAEGGVVVVLATGTDVMAWFQLPSADVGFHCVPDLVAHENDVFTVYRVEGFVGVGPEEQPGCV